MNTVQPVQETGPFTSGTPVPRTPVPVTPQTPQPDSAPPVHFSWPNPALAGRLAEKDSLFDAARKTSQSTRTTKAQKLSLNQAKARLEQIKLYSPYPADESPRAALIRRLIRLQEPPGDPSTLNLGVAQLTPDATDHDVSRAIAAVQTAQAQLTQDPVEAAPAPEDPTHAVELSVGLSHSWPQGTGISVSADVHYLRTL